MTVAELSALLARCKQDLPVQILTWHGSATDSGAMYPEDVVEVREDVESHGAVLLFDDKDAVLQAKRWMKEVHHDRS